MTKSTKNILGALLILLLLITAIIWQQTGSPLAVGLLFIGPIYGPITLLQGNYTLAFKLCYLAATVLAIVAIGLGIKRRQQTQGEALIVAGICAWAILGLMGLSA